ncbi:DUF4123 domain-containing protein [Photobacterium jeanii]|nr:DUF4123 domain-containing protein [Photobacterium jeanii]
MSALTSKELLELENNSLYLILDINYFNDKQIDVYNNIICNDWVPLFCNTPYDGNLDVSPIIIKLESNNEILLEKAKNKIAGIVLNSNLALDELQQKLAYMLTVESDIKKEGICLLRFYSPITASYLIKKQPEYFGKDIKETFTPSYSRLSWNHSLLKNSSDNYKLKIDDSFRANLKNQRMAYYLGYYEKWKKISNTIIYDSATSLVKLIESGKYNKKEYKEWENLILSFPELLKHNYWIHLTSQNTSFTEKWKEACFLVDSIKQNQGFKYD